MGNTFSSKKKWTPFNMKELTYNLDGVKVNLMHYALYACFIVSSPSLAMPDDREKNSLNRYFREMLWEESDDDNEQKAPVSKKDEKHESNITLQYLAESRNYVADHFDELRTFTFPHFIYVNHLRCFSFDVNLDIFKNEGSLRKFLCAGVASAIGLGYTADDFIKGIYGRDDIFKDAPYSTDLTFPAYIYMIWNSIISYFETLKGMDKIALGNAAVSLFKYKVPAEKIEKCFKGTKSPLRQYLTGKITLDEYNSQRTKLYKNRPNDFEADYLYLFMSKGSSNIKRDVSNVSLNTQRLAVDYATIIGWRSDLETVKDMIDRSLQGEYDLFDLSDNYKNAVADKEREETRHRETERKRQALERQLQKCKTKLDDSNSEIIALRDENKSLKKNKKLNDEVTSMQEKVKRLEAELISVKKEKKEAENESAEQKRKNAKLLKDIRTLEAYKMLFGDIYEAADDTEEEEVSTVSESDMIEELKDLKIALACYEKAVLDKLNELGFNNVYLVDSENGSCLTKKYDIVVIFSDYISHKVAYASRKMAENIGAMTMFYEGSNVHKFIEALYKYLNK